MIDAKHVATLLPEMLHLMTASKESGSGMHLAAMTELFIRFIC